jgi:hypothetical protein
MSFLTQNKTKLCKKLIISLLFEKNVIYFAENCQKLQTIGIITSTTDFCEKNAQWPSKMYPNSCLVKLT